MNKWLAGNGYWCPDCGGSGRGKPADRIDYEGGAYAQFYDLCPTCRGGKRLAATAAEIIGGTVPATPSPAEHSCFLPVIEYGHERKRKTQKAAARPGIVPETGRKARGESGLGD